MHTQVCLLYVTIRVLHVKLKVTGEITFLPSPGGESRRMSGTEVG